MFETLIGNPVFVAFIAVVIAAVVWDMFSSRSGKNSKKKKTSPPIPTAHRKDTASAGPARDWPGNSAGESGPRRNMYIADDDPSHIDTANLDMEFPDPDGPKTLPPEDPDSEGKLVEVETYDDAVYLDDIVQEEEFDETENPILFPGEELGSEPLPGLETPEPEPEPHREADGPLLEASELLEPVEPAAVEMPTPDPEPSVLLPESAFQTEPEPRAPVAATARESGRAAMAAPQPAAVSRAEPAPETPPAIEPQPVAAQHPEPQPSPEPTVIAPQPAAVAPERVPAKPKVKPLPPKGERVDVSVFVPRQIKPRSAVLLDVWAYKVKDYPLVCAKASKNKRGAGIGGKSDIPLDTGTLFSVRIDLPNCKVVDRADTIVWEGSPASASFIVEVPEKSGQGAYPGTASIYVDGLLIARIGFLLTVSASGDTGYVDGSVERNWVNSAYACYAADDAPAVMSRIEGMQKVSPHMSVFVDVESLRTGDDWQQKLDDHVPNKGRFYLFWSRNAADSEWVETEWRLALAQRGVSYIDPVPLDDPAGAPPPKELEPLDFAAAYQTHLEYLKLKRRLARQGRLRKSDKK